MSDDYIGLHPIVEELAERAGTSDGDSVAFLTEVVREIERLRAALVGLLSLRGYDNHGDRLDDVEPELFRAADKALAGKTE